MHICEQSCPDKGIKVTFAKFSILNGYILHHIVHADLLICVVRNVISDPRLIKQSLKKEQPMIHSPTT